MTYNMFKPAYLRVPALLFSVSWIALGTLQADIPCKLGDRKASVVAAAFAESGGMLYRDELSVVRFVVTWKPFGMFAIKYACVFDDDEVAFVRQRVGSWTGASKTPSDRQKGNKEVVRYLKGVAKARKAKTIESVDGRTVYAFSRDAWQGRIVLNTSMAASGEVVEHSAAHLSGYKPRAREAMWFGTGSNTGESIARDERTTSIPHRVGQWFVWSVDTGLDTPTEVSVVVHYPQAASMVDKSPEIVLDPEARTFEMPFGLISGEFTLELQVEDGDPSGLYRIYLTAQGENIAGVSYELETD